MTAAALIEAFHPGMRGGGQAVTELISGQIEPTGRLPISFACHVGSKPSTTTRLAATTAIVTQT